jgi:hypothetical protein
VRIEIDRSAPKPSPVTAATDDDDSEDEEADSICEPLRLEIDRPTPVVAAVSVPPRGTVEPQSSATSPVEPPVEEEDAPHVEPDPPALDATQLISRNMIDSALRGPVPPGADGEGESAIEATQVIAPDVITAAQSDPAATMVGTIHLRPEDTGPMAQSDVSSAERVSEPGDGGGDPQWEAPAELEDALGRFNAAHRLVYRAVRSEVGAGATNFLRATCIQRAPEAAVLVDGVLMGADGSWDTEGLRQAVVERRESDPWSHYVSLLEVEIERIAEFLGTARATDLRRQIESLDERSAVR